MTTFYWHDYETWGANPAVDRPSQFAGVRTDEDLNIIGEPLVLYCQPPADIWPHPEACLITGITPQHAKQKGLPENEFIRQIHRQLAQPQTCGVGYNSLRFDDEVTRYALYRNFYDPYEREWRNGSSRWDIIDMVRLVYALRPQSIEWPRMDGVPSFKLENLSAANNLVHANAHDAYSDVEATIALAKLIKNKQPALYDYVLSNKSKHKVAAMIDTINRKPLFHISSKFPASRGCAGFVAPIAMHATNRNAVIVFDLSADPAPLLTLSADEIRARIFVKTEDLPEGVERIPLKLIHFNKCPILGTTKLCDDQAALRLNIDKQTCDKHWQKLCTMDIEKKIQAVFAEDNFAPRADPEQMLYNGFVPDEDKVTMKRFRQADEKSLIEREFVFSDARLDDMKHRYKARNFPHLLNDDERTWWENFRTHRLLHGDDNMLSREKFVLRITELKHELAENIRAMSILRELEAYEQAN